MPDNTSNSPQESSPSPGKIPGPRLNFEDRVENGQRELVLVKNGQRYVFRCTLGEESDMLKKLGDMVRDTQIDLDWFDAAVLSHQIGQRIADQVNQTHQHKQAS